MPTEMHWTEHPAYAELMAHAMTCEPGTGRHACRIGLGLDLILCVDGSELYQAAAAADIEGRQAIDPPEPCPLGVYGRPVCKCGAPKWVRVHHDQSSMCTKCNGSPR